MDHPDTHSGEPSALRLGLVGAGALGSELCRLLIEQGHANVLLIDPDQMEPHNVAMSALFRQAQPGLNPAPGTLKVEVIRRMAAQRGLSWDTLPVEIADAGWGDLARCDVLVCCADSVLARVETAGAARSLGLPMLEAAVSSAGSSHGRVSSFPANVAQACYLCSLSEHRRAEVLAYALSTSIGCFPSADFPGMTGSELTLSAVAAELFRLLQEPIQPEAFVLRLGAHTGSKDRVALSRSATCPWHELPAAPDLISLPFDEALSKAFKTLPARAVLELFWPVCLHSHCAQCGALAPDARRTALVRRKGVCPACATPGSLEPLQCVQSFRADDPQAQLTPRELGLPERHLYYWRPGAQARERHTKHP